MSGRSPLVTPLTGISSLIIALLTVSRPASFFRSVLLCPNLSQWHLPEEGGSWRDGAGLLQTAATAISTAWLSQPQSQLCLLPWPLSTQLSGWQDNILSHHLEKCLWVSPLYTSSHPDVILLPWGILSPRHHFSSLSMDSYLGSHSPSPQLSKPFPPEGDQGSRTISALSGHYTAWTCCTQNMRHCSFSQKWANAAFLIHLLRNGQTSLVWISFKRARLNKTFTMKNCSVNS